MNLVPLRVSQKAKGNWQELMNQTTYFTLIKVMSKAIKTSTTYEFG